MKYVVEHFQPKEFSCRCCGKGFIVASLVYFLDEFRRAWAAPVLVTSGFRCRHHNGEVGGAPNSRHLIGCAADIKPVEPELITPFTSLMESLTSKRKGWEVKFYPRFIHVAVPREEAGRIWTGGSVDVIIQ